MTETVNVDHAMNWLAGHRGFVTPYHRTPQHADRTENVYDFTEDEWIEAVSYTHLTLPTILLV